MDKMSRAPQGASQITDGASGFAKLFVNAGISIGEMRNLHGASGMPGPACGAEQIPDLSRSWKSAQVKLVRTYDWASRLDTVDNPASLFPQWSADPSDPASYNFAATDSWIRQVQAIGAEIIFTLASAIPSNKHPASDLAKYEQVVENIVRHYVTGWGGGEFSNAVTRWEFGDQPDFGMLHFDGSPDDFYGMYAAAARAVKRVDPALKFGGPCIAFPLDKGPYREGLLDFVQQRALPLDFLTWMWFTDHSRDPMEFRTVSGELRRVLDSKGFDNTELILVYWNMTGIPNAKFEDADAAAFQAAAAIYMQDSAIDRAIFFRADTGTDLHYKITDPAGIFGADGGENAKTASYTFTGQTLASPRRLTVVGGDDNGFAVLAGRTETADVVRVLIANYAIPDGFLTPRDRDVFEFQVPIGSVRSDMSLSVPPRRTHAKSAGWGGYTLEVTNLPWGDGPHKIERYRADDLQAGEMVGSFTGYGDTAIATGQLPAPAVELIVIRPVSITP